MQSTALKSFLLIGAGVAAAWMASNPKQNVAIIKSKAAELKEKMTPNQEETGIVPIKDSWSPDSYDVDNNEMVSEGSTYGVQYYNEKLQS